MFKYSCECSGLEKKVRFYESRLAIPNYSGFIDLKHDHIRCFANVVSNFITVRRTAAWWLLDAVDKTKFHYIDSAIIGRLNDAVVFSKGSFKETPQMNILNILAAGVLWLMIISLSEVIFCNYILWRNH